MKVQSKDLLIIVMTLFIVALMVLLYKVNTLVIDRIPKHVEPKVYVADLTEAVERQCQYNKSLTYSMGWLKRHLENTLALIESERGLEPIPKKHLLPPLIGQEVNSETSHAIIKPFYIPYEKPVHVPETPQKEKELKWLICHINLNAVATSMAMYSHEFDIDNFQQRLERIAPDPNTIITKSALESF